MRARELRSGVAVHGGHGSDRESLTPTSDATGGPAAQTPGDVAAGHLIRHNAGPGTRDTRDASDPWPAWARAQLQVAQQLVLGAPDRGGLASALYREWFCAPMPDVASWRAHRPPAGVYRSAHAGTSRRVVADGVAVVERHDVLGRDGWWRTWGRRWTPPRSRPGSVRVLCTPAPDLLAEFVTTVTGALLDSDQPWSLTCATDPRRLRRTGAAVLDLPALDMLPTGLLDALAPTLLPAAPPLCLPVADGVAVAGYPDNGMTFGEHRCHLIALALRRPASPRDALRAIAETFTAHRIDPAQPYR